MSFSRRDFIHAGCAVAAATLVPNPLDARVLRASTPGAFSQRSVINLGFLNDNSYPFINFYLAGDGSTSPVGSAFSQGTPWPALIDANGWPNQPGVSGTHFGGSVRVPGPDEYSGNWVMTWNGNGRLDITLGGGTWTESNLITAGVTTISIANPAVVTFANSFSAGQQVVLKTTGTLPTGLSPATVYYISNAGLTNTHFQLSTTLANALAGVSISASGSQSGKHTVNGTYVKNANGRWSNAFETIPPYIVARFSGVKGPQNIPTIFALTDPGNTGHYLTKFEFYQQRDEPDLLAGNVFRNGFKQSLVNLNPSAIRFINWAGSSAARMNRFENRTLPTNAGYSYFADWTSSPSYAAVTGTNIWSVGVAVPTTANPKSTPASLTHGEIAVVRFTTGTARSGGQYGISAITNANPGVVATSSAHGLNTGDTAIHFNMVGMNKLNYFPVVVTVIDSTHYSIGVDTTSYGAGTSGLGTQYWSIDVGARGAKPISWSTGSQPASVFGNTLAPGNYCALAYDKNIALQSDGAGNMIFGAWVFQGSGSGWQGDVPLEIMTALVNEVNALSVSQGITTPINMWLNIPHTGLTSMDSDYTTASDYALNAVDVITSSASSQRTVGYSALTAEAKLFIEYSNETWNSAGGFWAFYYLTRMGFLRWPSSGRTNAVDMYVLRSTIVMRTVKATFGTSRVKYVLSGQGILGFNVGDLNEVRCNASTTPGAAGNFYLTDKITVGGDFGTPITNHDCFATATYFDGDPNYYSGQFASDSANYATANPAFQPIAIASFVSDIVSGPGQSVHRYLNNSLSGLTATYASAMRALGKVAINYEGGPDWQTVPGQSLQGVHTITSADSTFLIAVLDSTQWRDAQVNYFNRTSQLASSAMPSVYTYVGASGGNQRWAYCSPDSFGGTTAEGQGLLNSPVWVGMGARNQALSP